MYVDTIKKQIKQCYKKYLNIDIIIVSESYINLIDMGKKQFIQINDEMTIIDIIEECMNTNNHIQDDEYFNCKIMYGTNEYNKNAVKGYTQLV